MGKELLRDPQVYPVAAVLIHDVFGDKKTPSPQDTSSNGTRRPYRHSECENFGLEMFQSYVTAACQLYARGILSVEAVGRIIRSTISDLSSIKFDTELQKRSITKQVMADISLVVDKLPTNKDAMVMLEGFHDHNASTTNQLVLSPSTKESPMPPDRIV